jgi:uncharacterized membrane-anchored protein YitT (DUF2179 family)
MTLLILGIPLCAGMIFIFWNLPIWLMVSNIYFIWSVRSLGLVPLCIMLFFISCLSGTGGWAYRWDGRSDGTDDATKEMKKAFKRQTGKDFPE